MQELTQRPAFAAALLPSGRGIPAGCVAPPSNTPGILTRRALPSGRRAPESSPVQRRRTTSAVWARLGESPRQSS